MIPIALDWRHCPDGVETKVAEHAPSAPIELWFVPRSPRRRPVGYNVANLEDPFVIRFLNCKDRADLEQFFSRFGPLHHEDGDAHEDVAASREVLSTAVGLKKEVDREDHFILINHMLDKQAPMRLGFEWIVDGKSARMVVRPENLYGLMCAEIAMATELGVDLRSCEHCGDAFFTGHMTGRRSSAKYCSDRCRVAAMRARNAGKE